MVQAEARRFIGLALGPDGAVPDDFANYEQNATLQILIAQNDKVERLMTEGEVEEATDLFNLTADGLQVFGRISRSSERGVRELNVAIWERVCKRWRFRESQHGIS